MKKTTPEMLTLHQVFKLRLIPWALGRNKLTSLFHDGIIRSIRGGTPTRPRYYTTRAWVDEYVKRNLQKRH